MSPGEQAVGKNEDWENADATDAVGGDPTNDLEQLLAKHALDPFEGVFGPDGKVLSAAGRGVGLRFVATYFPESQNELRIATSYFKLGGYKLGRGFIGKDTKVHVLVGQAQGGEATQTVVGEMVTALGEIMRELGTTPFSLADAVEELVARIDAGKFVIRSASEMVPDVPHGQRREYRRFHCKFYIADDAVVWTGSANFTWYGLSRLGNDEQLTASRNVAEIKYFRRYYDEQLASGRDLLEELQAMLKQWLRMHDPFDAYLKALLCSYESERYPVEKPANEPTYFQEGIIVCAVEQARRYDGALLLVATGLGKTVIGAEIARRILSDYSSSNVRQLIVVAPRATEKGWRDELRGRGYKPEFFDNSALFKAASEDDSRQTSQLEQCIQRCNASTVFLIDEAHRYRNLLLKAEQTNRRNRRRTAEPQEYNRVMERVDQIANQKSKIILLTATPYGTNKQNINSLLRMLPPKAPPTRKAPKNLFEQENETQGAAPATSTWSVSHVDKTSQLGVVTILGMVHVLQMARDRGNVETDGRLFIAMRDDSRRYLPKQIRFHRVSFPLFLQERMERAYDAKAFDAQVISYLRWNEEKDAAEAGATNIWMNNTFRAWLSSPRELKRVLDICYNTPDPAPNSETGGEMTLRLDLPEPELETAEGGDTTASCRLRFILSQAKRQREIKPLLAFIESADDKLAILIEVLEPHRAKGEKAIIFVKRHATALYLQEKLGDKVGRIGCTIVQSGLGGEGKIKTDRQRQRLIRNFAPDANTSKGGRRPPEREHLDILICTDADGIGQNMQDALVVINYDLPLTADELFQRTGRVLRPTPERDREVDIYTFVPDVNGSRSNATRAVSAMVHKLSERQNEANGVIPCGKVLPDDNDLNPVVMSLARAQNLDNVPTHYRSLEDGLLPEASSASRHISRFELYEHQARTLKETNVMSAKKVKSAKVRQPCVCVFIKGRRGIEHVLFNTRKKQIEPSTREEVLDLLECPPDEKKDTVSVKQVETAAIEAFEAWREQQSEMDRFFPSERICAVYLRPEISQEPGEALGRMLKQE